MKIGRGQKLEWKAQKLEERTDDLHNPYRGMYSIYRFLAESGLTKDEQIPVEQVVLRKDETLVLLEISLQAYNDRALTADALKHIDRILAFFEAKNYGCILRFVYDWDGQGLQAEPGSVDIILLHMQQLSDILHWRRKSIYIAQGLFTGSWGEMHDTHYGSERFLRRLMEQYSDATASGTFLAVRSPAIWRSVFKSYQICEDEHRGHLRSSRCRVGLFNDGIMGSETDLGTYRSSGSEEVVCGEERISRGEELQFQNRLCGRVPNGGEVVNPSELNDFDSAEKTMREMRISYLNSGYDPEVLDKWKNTIITDRNSVWNGKSGYEYMVSHLGYRYMIRDVKMVSRGNDRFDLNLIIENTGFSPCYRKLRMVLVLSSDDGKRSLRIPVSAITRTWFPGQRMAFHAGIDLSSYGEIRWHVGIDLHCAVTKQPVVLANVKAGVKDTVPNKVGVFESSAVWKGRRAVPLSRYKKKTNYDRRTIVYQ